MLQALCSLHDLRWFMRSGSANAIHCLWAGKWRFRLPDGYCLRHCPSSFLGTIRWAKITAVQYDGLSMRLLLAPNRWQYTWLAKAFASGTNSMAVHLACQGVWVAAAAMHTACTEYSTFLVPTCLHLCILRNSNAQAHLLGRDQQM